VKKLAIIGKGTAGALAVNYFSHYTDYEIDLYFDSSKKPQTVGEGSQFPLLSHLHDTLNLSWEEAVNHLDGHIKKGIEYIDWRKDFIHHFPMPYVALHFNSVKLQEYLIFKNRRNINFIDKNIEHKDIDSDFILDCSGTPKDFSEYETAEYIPVNSSLVRHYKWDKPQFDYTKAIARPHGWIFGIPLKNRVSYGYMFNRNINSIEEVEDDFAAFEKDKKLRAFYEARIDFNNYYKTQNFTERVAYNGNASFFLEPLEATSIDAIQKINNLTRLVQSNQMDVETANNMYKEQFKEYQEVITLHYFGGSKYKTPFWDYASDLGQNCMKEFKSLKYMLELSQLARPYGSWGLWSFRENINGLDIKDKLMLLWMYEKD